MKIDLEMPDTGDRHAARLAVKPNVLEALKRYVASTRVLADNGELMVYGDGRPVVLDVVAAFHIICDAEDQHTLEQSADTYLNKGLNS